MISEDWILSHWLNVRMAYEIRRRFEMVEWVLGFASSISADMENHWRKSGTTDLISFLFATGSGNEVQSSTDLRDWSEGIDAEK